MVRGWAGFLFLMMVALSGSAQESVTAETSPASMKWFQINTNHFRVLYPDGFETQAQRVANTLEHIREPEAKTIGSAPKKISILLHSQSSVSNGFVTLAPRRSEYYAMPPQNYNFSGTNEWLSLLSAHEYRHMAQFQSSITGFNKGIYFLFGQLAQASMAFVAVPQWFWEGDAVATETAFTQSGRGRIPEFNLLMRTNLLEGRNFGYHKQYLRSFKHNIPNHYVLGYHMVSYLRQKTGNPDVWHDITKRAWNVPFIPFTFSNAIKKETGLHVTDLYDEMADDIKTKWETEQALLQLTDFQKINVRSSNAYTDYSYPQPLSDGRVLVLKSGIGDIFQFVTLTNGGEEREHTPGLVNDAGMLSVGADKVVWNEYRFDPRWQIRSYSIIKGYDLAETQSLSGKKKVVVKTSRYAGASISPDGSKVVTVETDDSYQVSLVVLDYNTGRVIDRFANPNNDLISMPRWSDNGKSIVYIRLTKNGKVISSVDVDTEETKDLYDAKDENVGHPVLYGDDLFFNSPYSGIDNIYCLDTSTDKRYQVTSSKYGAYNPAISPDGKHIYYNDQSKDGLDVVRVPYAKSAWKEIENVSVTNDLFSATLAEQEGEPNLLQTVPNERFATRRYRRSSGMINPHSWGVYVLNSLSQANLGIVSRDILSTTEISGGYQFDINERTGTWRAGISYQGMYPIFDGEFTYAKREEDTGAFGRDVSFQWTEIGGNAGLRIPLLLTQSKFHRSVSVSNAVGYSQVSGFKYAVTENGSNVGSGFGRLVPANDTLFFNFTDRVSNGDLVFNHFSFTASNLLKQSRRDFNPRFGQAFVAETYSTILNSDFEGRMNVARATLFFPGLFKHHSLYFRGGYQESLSDPSLSTYQFRNRISKPRGYSYPRDTKFISLSANYALPIWYPDISLGPILNLQRIKTNLFFDYGKSEGLIYLYRFLPGQPTQRYFVDNGATYQSMGAEVTFDINVMRFLPIVEVGVRASYLTANKFFNNDLVVEFIIGKIPF